MPKKIESKKQFRFLWSQAHKRGPNKAITLSEMEKLADKTDYDKLPESQPKKPRDRSKKKTK